MGLKKHFTAVCFLNAVLASRYQTSPQICELEFAHAISLSLKCRRLSLAVSRRWVNSLPNHAEDFKNGHYSFSAWRLA